ncbi:short-chain-fatty-acid--CoA ligase (acyl-CoA synthetase) [Escherichia coli]|uniref:Short-chain-fatty-acid--CoA ligase (Acyl-CoA synthetase) n=1 Tax=Escherichia coli TaxID=562 RepID=A0A2X1KGJ5_ECOLX|nr:short-chain-fatty-acid--CoA ligase (acyl-CoA synthetase) [Escherichia coli]
MVPQESSPHAVVNLDDPLSRFMHTDGYAAAGVEIKVVDDARKTLPPGCEGEEASRGPMCLWDILMNLN